LYPKTNKTSIRTRIRAHLSVNHQLSLFELLDKLEAAGLHLDRDYLSKLVGKVFRERIKRADRQTLNQMASGFYKYQRRCPIQNALEALEAALGDARQVIKARIKKAIQASGSGQPLS